MFSKNRIILASSCVLLALSSCETGTLDFGSDGSSGGQGGDGSDEDSDSGADAGSGGRSSGGAASGGAASGGTASGGSSLGGSNLGGNTASGGSELGGEGNLGGAGGGDIEDGEEIGEQEPGSGGTVGTGGADPGSGGAPPVEPVSGSIRASITKQITPLETNDPYLIEVGTLTYYPVKLENVAVTAPEGWVLSHVESGGGECPRTQNGTLRCLQFWQAYLYPTEGICRLNQDQLTWTWDASCALGADCSVMPSGLPDPVQFTTTHSSENFCEQDIDVPPFLPTSSIILPTEGNGPVTIRYFTSLADPYRFTPGEVTVPSGMSLVDFTESSVACHDSNYPNGCRQWWDLVVDPGDACTVSGNYTVVLDVDCELGESCDPSVTTYTNHFEFVDRRTLCE